MFSASLKMISKPIRRGNVAGSVAKATGAFLRAQGAVYLRLMAEEAPVGQTGQLARSHVLRIINQYRAEVVNTDKRAAAVHEGSRPHMPPSSSGLPYPVRRYIAMHGTRPNPWMGRASQAGAEQIQANAEKLASDIAKEIM